MDALEAEADVAAGTPPNAAHNVPASIALFAQIEIVKKPHRQTINTS